MFIPPSVLKHSWFLAGPTACGKTATSLLLAERLDAEIISLDSMAIYRGMDVGTAKPNLQERQRVRHHLIDVAEPWQDFSVAEYLKMAAAAAESIAARSRTPLFVGGTGLYLRSALRGMFEGPEADWTLRRELELLARQNGTDWLQDQLRDIDPVAAGKLHASDMRRIIRAIEVHRLTGRRLSDDQTQQPLPPDLHPTLVVWLSPPRDWLRERIDRRVDDMMAGGLLDEVRCLNSLDRPLGRTASQALGYRELLAHLHGERELGSAVAQIKTGTRQFAKRQQTWFRNLAECRSLEMSGTETPDELVSRILAMAAVRIR